MSVCGNLKGRSESDEEFTFLNMHQEIQKKDVEIQRLTTAQCDKDSEMEKLTSDVSQLKVEISELRGLIPKKVSAE